MVDYSDVQTELNSKWNTGVIAKPTFEDGELKLTSLYPNTLFITMGGGGDLKYGAINSSLEQKTTFFSITIYANTRSDLEKFIGETRRIINAKSISGGWWHVDRLQPTRKVNQRFKAVMECKEILMVAASGWS